jgi:hypothetical protein
LLGPAEFQVADNDCYDRPWVVLLDHVVLDSLSVSAGVPGSLSQKKSPDAYSVCVGAGSSWIVSGD